MWCTPLYSRKKIKSTLNLPKYILFVNTGGSVSGDDDGGSVDDYGVDGGCGCVGGDDGGDSGDDYGVDGGGGRVGADDSGGVDDGGGGFVGGGDDGGDGCYDYGGDDGGGDDDGSGGDDAIDGWWLCHWWWWWSKRLNWRTCKCLAVWVHTPLFLQKKIKSTLNLPKYILFVNTGSAPVWILCQFICNRLVARIALLPRHGVNVDPCPLTGPEV